MILMQFLPSFKNTYVSLHSGSRWCLTTSRQPIHIKLQWLVGDPVWVACGVPGIGICGGYCCIGFWIGWFAVLFIITAAHVYFANGGAIEDFLNVKGAFTGDTLFSDSLTLLWIWHPHCEAASLDDVCGGCEISKVWKCSALQSTLFHTSAYHSPHGYSLAKRCI